MAARVRGVLGVRIGGAGVRTRVDDSGVVIDLVRPWRLARASGLRGMRGLRALRAIAAGLRRLPVPIRVRAAGVTALTAGRGVRRVSPWGLALAAVAVVAARLRRSKGAGP